MCPTPEENRLSVLDKIDELIEKRDSVNDRDIWIATSFAELQAAIATSGVDPKALAEIFLTAVKKNVVAFFLIPEADRNFEIYLAIAKQEPEIITILPEHLKKNKEIYLAAIEK